MKFALNHMVAPTLNYREFFDLALRMGVDAVEIRNDIPVSQMSKKSAKIIGNMAKDKGLKILNVNALQRWNQWDKKRASEANHLAEYTALTGAKALVLCPTNDTKFRPRTPERLDGIKTALSALKQILKDHGLIGCVEPLGFAECSLRLKAEAVAAINDIGGGSRFKLTHDTFHHFVAGETEFFPSYTALIHVSGVVDRKYSAATMRDPQRVLVDSQDMLDNRGQVKKMFEGGYKGYVSFEPFAPVVHKSKQIAREIARSMDFIEG